MKPIRKVLAAALLVPFALAGANSLAAPQVGDAPTKDENLQGKPAPEFVDKYETIVPTPPTPPSDAEGYQPGDMVEFHRVGFAENFRYDRTTVYVRTMTGWGKKSSTVVKTSCDSVECPP